MIDRDGLITNMAPEFLTDLLLGLPKDPAKELLHLRQEAGRVSGIGYHEAMNWTRERSIGVILAHSLHGIASTMISELKRMDGEKDRADYSSRTFRTAP